MLFADKIQQLRKLNQLLQRQLASVLEINTPMYSKIERCQRPAKRAQVVALAKIFNADEPELLTLWLADKLISAICTEIELAPKAFQLAFEKAKNNNPK